MTSGSMPPHTQGGKTFIHDPRISNQPETKASIKLLIKTVKNKQVRLDFPYDYLILDICYEIFLAHEQKEQARIQKARASA